MNTIRIKSRRRKTLVLALALCIAGGAQAQSTTGSIYGSAGEGATITVRNASGLTRTVAADASGRYSIGTLPVGDYTVTIARGNEVVGTRTVTVRAGAGADASFGSGDARTLETVTVTGSAPPLIDITAVDARSVVTAAQLERLPLARTAEAVALLAPGAVSGAAGFFDGLVSFGGAGISENAYYVNGYFTGDPLSNLGGFTLPFGAIEQQETFIGGYSAKYGRSDGGVINQIGKRGTNEWRFGAQVIYAPKRLHAKQPDIYFPEIDLSAANGSSSLPSTCGTGGNEPCRYTYADPSLPGTLYSRSGARSNGVYQEGAEAWHHSYGAYAGGPLLKDRVFMFAAAEWGENNEVDEPNAFAGAPVRSKHYKTRQPRLYTKLDWNITDNHFVEFSYLGEKTDLRGTFHEYDFDTGTEGAELAGTVPDPNYQENRYLIGKYTGYLTDSLTLGVTAGRGRLIKQRINPSIVPGLPLIGSPNLQNPALNGGTPRTNTQGGAVGVDARDDTKGLRADLEWTVGDHALTVGIDNITFKADNEGQDQLVPRWIYGRTTGSIVPGVIGSPANGANPQGYYVQELIFRTATSMELDQKAWYLEDRWQVSDRLMLSLGIRNDSFTNINNFGEKYLDSKNQWAPRIGFAWDVNGDQSFKVFGNAGRYFLAMPNNVAIRGASASTFTREYYTYTGIDANGAPTGLAHVPFVNGQAPGPFSSNGEYGEPIDVLSFAPSDLKNMFQDEYILGMEHMLGERWMLGAKLTFRDLKSAIDDICDGGTMAAVLEERGFDTDTVEIPGCFMFNPGGTNTFSLANIDPLTGERTGSRTEVEMSSADWRFPDGMKRHYTGLDVYLEHAFDGKWEARIDYTYSRSEGNMEGQVKSEFGQANISKTQDWDAAEIMTYANGYLANDRRHQLKARGSWQVSDEWMLGANLRIQSGAPISCLGYFNPGNIDENSPDADPIHYGASYHTCFGEIAKPGSQRTPWTRTVDFGATYRPAALGKKLALGVQVLNVLNASKTLQVDVTSEADVYTVSNTYMLPIARQAPRTVVLTASYDW